MKKEKCKKVEEGWKKWVSILGELEELLADVVLDVAFVLFMVESNAFYVFGLLFGARLDERGRDRLGKTGWGSRGLGLSLLEST